MQDIRIVYPGELPQDFDFLQAQKNSKWGLASVLQAVLGPIGTWAAAPTVLVSNVECVPTAPATLSVLLRPIATSGPGVILTLANVDATALGGLSGVGGLLADTHNVVMVGILRDPVTLSTPTPTVSGYSINYLVEGQYAQSDAGNTLANLAGQTGVVLQYYNPTSTTVALSGPGGAGTAQNNDRLARFIVQVKAGAAAPTGTQLTPAPDVGFTGLFVVTVAFGQGTVAAGNISAVTTGLPAIAGLLASHHGGTAGQAPKVNLASEVQGLLPNSQLTGPLGSQNAGLLIPSCYSGAGAPSATTLSAGTYLVRDLYWDTTNNVFYLCKTTGTASTAVWQALMGPAGSQNSGFLIPSFYTGAGAPSATTLSAGTYVIRDLYWDSTNSIVYTCKTTGTASTAVWQALATASALSQMKRGSGAADYTTQSATYVDIDATNLIFTALTVPSGKIVKFEFSCVQLPAGGISGAIAIVKDGVVVIEDNGLNIAVSGGWSALNLPFLFPGDGVSHTWKMQFHGDGSANNMSVRNATATNAPAFIVSYVN